MHKKKKTPYKTQGAVFGDLPPYEAFSLGGTNSVRGYGEGSLGTGRAYAEATAIAVVLLAMSLTLLVVINVLQHRLSRNAVGAGK